MKNPEPFFTFTVSVVVAVLLLLGAAIYLDEQRYRACLEVATMPENCL